MMYVWVLMSCSGQVEKEAEVSLCEGSTEVLYNPKDEDTLLAYPDDFFRVQDSTRAGYKLDMSVERAPWTENMPQIFQSVWEDASTRSGFARLGSVVLRFSAPVAPAATSFDESLLDERVIWLDLSADPPQRVAYTSWLDEKKEQLILKPMRPLRPDALHAVFVTDQYTDSAGACLSSSSLMKELMDGTSGEEWQEHSDRIQHAIEKSAFDRDSLRHVQVFTTHNDLQMMRDVAADIRTRNYEWLQEPECVGEGNKECTGIFLANDYRTGASISSSDPVNQWPLTVRIWLPDVPSAPLVMYGHGINSRAESGGTFASLAQELGLSVVAVDALHHGDHPTADPDSPLPALNFLGINISQLRFDTENLRGSFDQTIADRLQTLELLRQNLDVDMDGEQDIEVEEIIYYGDSLGGMLGPQLVANHEDFGAAVFAIAGGDLPVFTTDTAEMENYQGLIETLVGPPERFERLTPVIQTLVDASDPAVWGYHVVENRFDEASAPSILFPVCDTDTDVPPAAAKALAYSLALPHLAPVVDPVPMLSVVDAPIEGNLSSGQTGAYFQLDRVSSSEGVVPSTHGNVPYSPEGRLLTKTFLETHLEGMAVIINPYDVLETAPLE